MQRRILLFLSLGVNLAFAAAWLLFSRRHPAATESAASPENSSGPARTNVLVRRQYFSWSQVESADYPTYIANLRSIGCPEQTIRDIIIADVNALYAQSARPPRW